MSLGNALIVCTALVEDHNKDPTPPCVGCGLTKLLFLPEKHAKILRVLFLDVPVHM